MKFVLEYFFIRFDELQLSHLYQLSISGDHVRKPAKSSSPSGGRSEDEQGARSASRSGNNRDTDTDEESSGIGLSSSGSNCDSFVCFEFS